MSIPAKHLKRSTSKNKLNKALKSLRKSSETVSLANDHEIQKLRTALKESQSTGDSLLQRLSDSTEANKRISAELRAQRYTNMKVKQQLEDERNIYLIEKKQLFDEICSLKHQLGYSSNEDNRYRQLIIEHNQQMCELCVKFLKLRNTMQKLRKEFMGFQKEAMKEVNKLNCRIRELAEALTQLPYAGQYSKPYIKATRRYLELQHDNQRLNKQVYYLQALKFGLTIEQCFSLKHIKNATTMTDFSSDFSKKDINSKANKIRKKKQKKISDKINNLNPQPTITTISESTSKQTVNNDLISFDDVEIKSRPHGDGADHSDVAQIEVTQSTSTSYFTLEHILADYGTDISLPINHTIGAMRTQSNPEIIKPRNIESLDTKYMCYRKDIGTNT